MFKMTDSAYKRLQTALEKEKHTPEEKLFIRLSMGIGWGGPKLNLSLEEQMLQNDQLFEFEELQILIHEKDNVYFDNTKLDYTKDVFGNAKFQLLKI